MFLWLSASCVAGTVSSLPIRSRGAYFVKNDVGGVVTDSCDDVRHAVPVDVVPRDVGLPVPGGVHRDAPHCKGTTTTGGGAPARFGYRQTIRDDGSTQG